MNLNFLKNKKILITGFNGFKGSWMSLILYHLGAKVYGYSLNEKKNKINEEAFDLRKICKSIFYADIRNYKKLRYFFNKVNPDYCIHMAAQPLVIESFKSPLETFETNFNGTLNLLEISRKHDGVPTLIVTSDKCYLNSKNKILNENDPLGGDDPYSASKAATEVLSYSYIKSYNFKIATARGGNVIGGGDWNDNRLVPDIMRSIFLKKKLIIRNRNLVWPFQHILDVNFSYLKLLKLIISNNKYCSSYNIGPKNSYRVSEVLNFYKKYIKNNLVFKKEKLKEKPSIFLDIRKSKQLGIKNNINFKSTLKLTFDWYQVYFKRNKKIFDFSLEQIKNYLKQYD
jgi:CDP-glucose 4,6-dehydratase